MKNNSILLIVGTVVLNMLIGITIYFFVKPIQGPKGTNWSSKKEAEFKIDVVKLDTLYHNYKNLIRSNNQAQFIQIKSQLKTHLIDFKDRYCLGEATPAKIATKVYKNYAQLLFLNDKALRNSQEASNRAKQMKSDLEWWKEMNQRLTNENQALQQQLIMVQ